MIRAVFHRRALRVPAPAGCLLLMCAAAALRAAPLDQPTPEVLIEAQRIVQEMKENQRGPYRQILWFCNDGSVQPPVAFACKERGGGRQHAEYSPARDRLAELGWSVGTVYAALTPDELIDSGPRQLRLRQLPLERYLVDIDNGWVLRRALGYRGRVQVEDEASAGTELLLQLLSKDEWSATGFLLLRETARTIPHGTDTDLARTVRRSAVELAELEPAAERWRAEIHSNPGADITARLRAWLALQTRDEVRLVGGRLADDLDLLYGPAGVSARVGTALVKLRRSKAGQRWREDVTAALALPASQQVPALCRALSGARQSVYGELMPEQRLALMDAMQELETTVQLAYPQIPADASRSRRQLLALSSALLDCAYGSGLLSADERQAVQDGLAIRDDAATELKDYQRAVAKLKRAPAWALGTIRYTFAEALVRYTALDPRAARFSDDLLRGSPLWILGDTLKILSRDVDQLAGSVVEIAGRPVSTAVALNTGSANGSLRIFETIDAVEKASLRPTDIVVLPETIAELAPVAGILTLGEGNALSHVQLLARNFGIPNVAIDQETVDLIKPLEGRDVLLVVSSTGNVVLQPVDAALRNVIAAPSATRIPDTGKIDVPMPNLAVVDVLRLEDIGRQLSGKVVGPKAANLGELNRLFPGRVAPAVAVPFGIYARHLEAAGLDVRIEAAFANRADGSWSTEDFDAEIARIRTDIANLDLLDDVRVQLTQSMATAFGDPGSYGVFVRSDTNVEDLPQFTGAGLNETIPNVVGTAAQLAAVTRVWSSVLSPRALAWRSSVLENPSRIYASVLLMKSVPASKSGVLVTTNIYDRGMPGLSASAAWGVGGAVAGEAAESIVITNDGAELVSEAKSPYQRHLNASSGVTWLPAKSGRVLQDAEIAQLRALVEEVNDKYVPALDEGGKPRPWDIEFGFVDGQLTLFQIRPLVERASRDADALLQRLRPEAGGRLEDAVRVSLDGTAGELRDAY